MEKTSPKTPQMKKLLETDKKIKKIAKEIDEGVTTTLKKVDTFLNFINLK